MRRRGPGHEPERRIVGPSRRPRRRRLGGRSDHGARAVRPPRAPRCFPPCCRVPSALSSVSTRPVGPSRPPDQNSCDRWVLRPGPAGCVPACRGRRPGRTARREKHRRCTSAPSAPPSRHDGRICTQGTSFRLLSGRTGDGGAAEGRGACRPPAAVGTACRDAAAPTGPEAFAGRIIIPAQEGCRPVRRAAGRARAGRGRQAVGVSAGTPAASFSGTCGLQVRRRGTRGATFDGPRRPGGGAKWPSSDAKAPAEYAPFNFRGLLARDSP